MKLAWIPTECMRLRMCLVRERNIRPLAIYLAGRIFYRRKILSGVGVHIGGGGDG